MFEVAVEETFAAGHALRNYHGKCENVHGHNYRIRVLYRGEELDDAGLLVDFAEVKRHLRALIARVDHVFLNDIEPFVTLNPSAENIARYFHDELVKRLGEGPRTNQVRLAEVTVWETDVTFATYRDAN
ncbi:MAG: 6-carboxytetrahydropterin synthase QueD [Bryobacteraceae bacterium]|nr:6-carboxytetrahydropterin synthase QueD [Bryobacteraceae bacterium]